MVKLLLKHANDKYPPDETPLHLAVLFNHLEIVKLLLEKSNDKNPVDKDGDTPYQWAAQLGRLEIAKLLLGSVCSLILIFFIDNLGFHYR
jgi:ankyrin repeat protein